MPLFRILIAVYLGLLSLASAQTAPWSWAHIAGDLTSVAYDVTPPSNHGPSADSDVNMWVTQNDVWILQNTPGKRSTALWRWSSATNVWKLAGETEQSIEGFVPPPLPQTIDATPHATLHHSDEYELAEREAARKASEKAKQDKEGGKLEETTERQEVTDRRHPEAVLEAATTSDFEKGRLFMFGGRGGLSAKRSDAFWMYETENGKWTKFSGGEIDYTQKMCTIEGNHAAPEKGPCIITTSSGFNAIEFMDGAVYAAIQERGQDGKYTISMWKYDVDGDKKWSHLGVADGPLATSFPVKMQMYANDGSVHLYRKFVEIGSGSDVVGEIWRYQVASRAWSLVSSPTVPLKRTATWVVNGLIITYMPGGLLDGANSNVKLPEVPGLGGVKETERFIILDLVSGKLAAVEKPGVNGLETLAGNLGEFSDAYTPGRRFDGVRTGGYSASDGTLYMFGGSLVKKRNPDQRNDLWQCKLNVSSLREAAGL